MGIQYMVHRFLPPLLAYHKQAQEITKKKQDTKAYFKSPLKKLKKKMSLHPFMRKKYCLNGLIIL